jgi:hypothetical protein
MTTTNKETKGVKAAKKTQCPACGEVGTIAKRARAGRFAVTKGVRVELPAKLALTECSNCHELWLDDAEADAYSAAVDAAFEHEMATRAIAALAVLEDVVTQAGLEKLLHLSHGYLSKVRNEAKVPSPALVSNLALLAADPKRRVAELERFWSSNGSR